MTAAPSPPTSHTVRVEPAGLEIEVRPGETLFDAAWREGYAWPTICLGQALCTHCHIRLLSADDAVLSPMEKDERLALQRIARRLYRLDMTGLRLACQMEIVAGDLVVQQPTFKGERRPDADSPQPVKGEQA
jgi:ferredoxin, 2Fe-2S